MLHQLVVGQRSGVEAQLQHLHVARAAAAHVLVARVGRRLGRTHEADAHVGDARVRLAKLAKVLLCSPITARAKGRQAHGGSARQRRRQRHGRCAGSLHGVAHGAGRDVQHCTPVPATGLTAQLLAPIPYQRCPALEACGRRAAQHAVGAADAAAGSSAASPALPWRKATRVPRCATHARRVRRQPQGTRLSHAAEPRGADALEPKMYIPPDAFGGATPERTMAVQMKCVVAQRSVRSAPRSSACWRFCFRVLLRRCCALVGCCSWAAAQPNWR